MAIPVTFVGLSPEGDVLGTVFATVTLADGTVVVQEDFGPGRPGVGVNVVFLPAGTYFVTLRSDGYRFPFQHEVTLVAPPEIDPSDPTVIEVTGALSTAPMGGDTAAVVRVYGWLVMPSPNTRAGGEVQSFGASFSSGQGRHARPSGPTVTFENLGRTGGPGTLVAVSRTEVGIDRNGYFEVYLPVSTRFAVLAPGQVGKRYFVTPDETADEPLDSLIEATLPQDVYSFVAE